MHEARLVLAAQRGILGDVKRALAEAKAEAKAQGEVHGLPHALRMAAANNHVDVVNAILGSYSPDGLRNQSKLVFGALKWAARSGAVGCVRVLLEHGASLFAPAFVAPFLLGALLELVQNFSATKGGARNDCAVLQLLLQAKAGINTRGFANGRSSVYSTPKTPIVHCLHWAEQSGASAGHAVLALLAAKAVPPLPAEVIVPAAVACKLPVFLKVCKAAWAHQIMKGMKLATSNVLMQMTHNQALRRVCGGFGAASDRRTIQYLLDAKADAQLLACSVGAVVGNANVAALRQLVHFKVALDDGRFEPLLAQAVSSRHNTQARCRVSDMLRRLLECKASTEPRHLESALQMAVAAGNDAATCWMLERFGGELASSEEVWRRSVTTDYVYDGQRLCICRLVARASAFMPDARRLACVLHRLETDTRAEDFVRLFDTSPIDPIPAGAQDPETLRRVWAASAAFLCPDVVRVLCDTFGVLVTREAVQQEVDCLVRGGNEGAPAEGNGGAPAEGIAEATCDMRYLRALLRRASPELCLDKTIAIAAPPPPPPSRPLSGVEARKCRATEGGARWRRAELLMRVLHSAARKRASKRVCGGACKGNAAKR